MTMQCSSYYILAEIDNDKVYKTDGPQQIVWSIGPLNTNDEAGKHYSDGRITGINTLIQTGINSYRGTVVH